MIKRILIVDDDVDFVDACRNFLEAAGYEINCETLEVKVLAAIRVFMPQLILLDVAMKTETSGFDIADKINQDKELRSIPIMFLTGYFKRANLINRENKILEKWSNVKVILSKPVKPTTLLEAIKKVN